MTCYILEREIGVGDVWENSRDHRRTRDVSVRFNRRSGVPSARPAAEYDGKRAVRFDTRRQRRTYRN